VQRREFSKLLGTAAVSASAGAEAGYFHKQYERAGTARIWLGDTSEQNLKNTFAGESQASVRYTIFSNRA
jgi:hypothetical protein